MRSQRGFTLIEALAVSLTLLVLVAVVAPVLGQPGRLARLQTSRDNLRFWGFASGMYMGDFGARIPAYSWELQETYEVAGHGPLLMNRGSQDAHAWQNTDILRRLTGRIEGPSRIKFIQSFYVHRRWTQLVLIDYMHIDLLSDRRAIDPRDRNLLVWHNDPLGFEQAGPYPEPDPSEIALEPEIPLLQRWPFASSYQPVPASFSPDVRQGFSARTIGPTDTSNLFLAANLNVPLGRRTAFEIGFPAQKVFMFEWHDRQSPGPALWYGYPQARPNKLMFDGSVQDRPTGEAGLGFDPNQPDDPDPFVYRYSPLSTDPPGVGDPDAEYPVSFRFTRDGLAGFDYAP